MTQLRIATTVTSAVFVLVGLCRTALSESPEMPAWLRQEPSWVGGTQCGPNSLFILGRIIGRDVERAAVAKVCPHDPVRGVSLADLEDAGARIGLPVEVRQVTCADLARLPTPFVAHIEHPSGKENSGHFLVVFAHRRDQHTFGVIDGSSGMHSYRDAGSLCRTFSGYVLLPRRVDGIRRTLQCAFVVLTISSAAIFFLPGKR